MQTLKNFIIVLKGRNRRNEIKAIKVDEVWIQKPLEVREAVVNYFRSHVSSTWDQPKLDGVNFARLEEVENILMVAPFSLLEIEAVVLKSEGNKSLGPDGFNFAFIKAFWYLLKGNIRLMFDQFHGNEVLPKSFLSYFVALIPKIDKLKDYRPNSLLGCLYKVTGKCWLRGWGVDGECGF